MSNEQRAHDITLLYIKFLTDVDLKNAISDAKNTSSDVVNCPVDFYKYYMEIYPKVFKKINQDFQQ